MADMQAVVVRGGKTFAYERIPKPQLGPGDIIIEVEAAGICAADRKIYSGDHPWQLPDPYLPGHEYVGLVSEISDEAAAQWRLAEGDRITAEIIVPCRQCWFCHRGLYHHCDRPQVCVGAWADFMKIPQGAIVHSVPKSLPAQEAALIEPLSCSIHGVELADIGWNDVVVIAGLGAIGMGMLQVARLKTPRLLIGLDVDDKLLELAPGLGADFVFNPARDDVVAELQALTEGRGCDIYIEASGSPRSLNLGLEALRKAGRLVVFGVYARPATVDFNLVSEFKELEIVGGHLSPNAYPAAIRFLSEPQIDARAMVTDVFPLASFEAAIAAKGQADEPSIKTLLIP